MAEGGLIKKIAPLGGGGRGGSTTQWLLNLSLDPAALGLTPCIPEIFSEIKCFMLLRLISAYGKVNGDLKMLIEPI